MATRLNTVAMAAILATGMSTAAMAQMACPPGYALYGGICQPVPAAGNPVSGALGGAATGAASGNAAAGPIGGIVGGAVGTATGAVNGTLNTVTGTAGALSGSSVPPACTPGYTFYNGACYPAR